MSTTHLVTTDHRRTISVGGEVGKDGLRVSASVRWQVEHCKPVRHVIVKVGGFTAYTAPWSEQSCIKAQETIEAIAGAVDAGLANYLCKALGQVSL